MQELLNIKKTVLHTGLLITMTDILPHTLTLLRAKLKNGITIFYGMLDLLSYTEKVLQLDMASICNLKRITKHGNNNGAKK